MFPTSRPAFQRSYALWIGVLLYIGFLWTMSSASHPAFFFPLRLPITHGDKILHLAGYAFLGFLLFKALAGKAQSKRKMKFVLYVVMIGMAYSFLEELHQYFVPARSPSFYDALADGIGLLIGTRLAG